MNTTRLASLTLLLATITSGCAFSHHPTVQSDLGVAPPAQPLEELLATPGPVIVETIDSAEWAVDKSGLINLEHPRAKAAGLVDEPENIVVAFHVIRHPTKGTFIVDTGVERAYVDDIDNAAIRGVVAGFLHFEKLKVKRDLKSFIADEKQPLAGVFLTHLHLDHVMGLPDVPKGTPIYAGPGEPTPTSMQNAVLQPNIDRALAGHGALREWRFAKDARFDGVVDIFGDGSVWAIWVPGHTPGSTAYLVRTPNGPVLLTGDASHTTWGWENDVEPGEFSVDKPRSAVSLAKLRAFAKAHPAVEVRVGHQHFASAE